MLYCISQDMLEMTEAGDHYCNFLDSVSMKESVKSVNIW